MSKNRKDMQTLLRELEREHGAVVTMRASQHYMVKLPGCPAIFTSGTPSDHRAVDNFRAEVKRTLKVHNNA